MKPPCRPCQLTHLHSGLSECARCGAMVWQQSADMQMGFHGFRLSWSRAELQEARSGAAASMGQQILTAGVPGGWGIAHLRSVMTALISDRDTWQAALPRLTPGSADERFMLQQMAEVLTAP